MTLFIGLTGGIGAGKSEALAAFDRLGAATVQSDRVAHELVDEPEMLALIAERWGDDVIVDGRANRARVAEIVFADPGELRWLESELHPRVGIHLARWREALDPGVRAAVVEVPLLFEAAMEDAFDVVVAVVADDAIRERRLAERGQAGLEGRESRQLDQQEKARRADHVIRNDGTIAELEARVAEVLSEVSGGAAAS